MGWGEMGSSAEQLDVNVKKRECVAVSKQARAKKFKLQNILELLVPVTSWGRPTGRRWLVRSSSTREVFTVIHVECAARSKLEARLLTCQANPSRVSMVRGYM